MLYLCKKQIAKAHFNGKLYEQDIYTNIPNKMYILLVFFLNIQYNNMITYKYIIKHKKIPKRKKTIKHIIYIHSLTPEHR